MKERTSIVTAFNEVINKENKIVKCMYPNLYQYSSNSIVVIVLGNQLSPNFVVNLDLNVIIYFTRNEIEYSLKS